MGALNTTTQNRILPLAECQQKELRYKCTQQPEWTFYLTTVASLK